MRSETQIAAEQRLNSTVAGGSTMGGEGQCEVSVIWSSMED